MLQRLHALHDHLTGLAAAHHQQRQRLDSRDSNDSDNTTDSDNTADSDDITDNDNKEDGEDTPRPRTTHSARKRRRLEAAFMSPTEQQQEEERRSCKRSKLGHWGKAEHNMTTQTSPGALLETSELWQNK